MRIYSNTILSWPQVLHVSQVARLYSGKWLNYNFYKIQKTSPLIITTNSSIEYLEKNCKYYCYNRYYRDEEFEQYGNILKYCTTNNTKDKFCTETSIYIPKLAVCNDIIVFHNDINTGFPRWYQTQSIYLL